MRGRLIMPFVARLARLDTNATREGGGYDDDFRSVASSFPAGALTSARQELAAVDVPCQVEDAAWRLQRAAQGGNAPDTQLVLVFHFRDLERLGLVDAQTGDALVRVNDRLLELRDVRTGGLVQHAGELYVTEARPAGYGLGRRRNLLVVTLEERARGVVAG